MNSCTIQILDQYRRFKSLSKPNVHRFRASVDIPHQSYLMTSLFKIILVDTNGIILKSSPLALITEMIKCFLEISSDREGLPVEEDRMFAVS